VASKNAQKYSAASIFIAKMTSLQRRIDSNAYVAFVMHQCAKLSVT